MPQSPRVPLKTKRLLAYVGLALAVAVGLIRVEMRAGDASRAANRAEAAAAQFKQDTEADLLQRCHVSNDGRLAVRATFGDLVAIATSLPPPAGETAEQKQQREAQTQLFVNQFNTALEARLPMEDCDKDGAPG